MKGRTLLGVVLLSCLLINMALPQTATVDVTAPARRTDKTLPTFYRTVTSGAADSITWSAVPVSPQAVGPGGTSPAGTGARDSYVVVTTRHSVSGGTAQIEVGRYGLVSAGVYAFEGVADIQTATSTADTDGTGYYPQRSLYFDLAGCDYYDVRVTNVSGGTCAIKAWTIGQSGWAGQ